MAIICSLIGHKRSGRHAELKDDGWHSLCKRCGAKLQRTGPGHWVLEDGDAAPEAEQETAGPLPDRT